MDYRVIFCFFAFFISIGGVIAEEPPPKGTICDHLDNGTQSVEVSFNTEAAIDYLAFFIEATKEDQLVQSLITDSSEGFPYQKYCAEVCNRFHYGDQEYKKGICEGHPYHPTGGYKISKENGLCAYVTKNMTSVTAVLRQAFFKDQKAFFTQAVGTFDPQNKTFKPSSNKTRVSLYQPSGSLHQLYSNCKKQEGVIKASLEKEGWTPTQPVGNDVCVDLFKNLYIAAYGRVIERLDNEHPQFCKALCQQPKPYMEDMCHRCRPSSSSSRLWQQWKRLTIAFKLWWG